MAIELQDDLDRYDKSEANPNTLPSLIPKTFVVAARKWANAATLVGGGDQWIMEWEGKLIHPTDLPEGRYWVVPVTEDE